MFYFHGPVYCFVLCVSTANLRNYLPLAMQLMTIPKPWAQQKFSVNTAV